MASLSEGLIVYQLGADLLLLDIESKPGIRSIPTTLLLIDQEPKNGVKLPLDYLTTVHLSSGW